MPGVFPCDGVRGDQSLEVRTLIRSLGLWRAVLHRVRAGWPVATSAFLLVLGAATLLSAGALYGDAVALGGLQQALRGAPPEDRAIVVHTNLQPSEVAGIDGPAVEEVTALVAPSGGEVARVVRSDALADVRDPADARDLTLLAAYDSIEHHADLVAGRWPAAGSSPLEAALSVRAAAALGLTTGETVRLVNRADRSRTVEIEVVGTFEPHAADPYWLADALERDGISSEGTFTTRGPFVVDRADLLGATIARAFELQWRGLPSIDGLTADDLDGLARGIDALDNRLGSLVSSGSSVRVVSALPGMLDVVSRSVLVSRSGVLLLTLQFAALAGYALILVAGVVLDHRRSETMLIRARGAGGGHLALMTLIEALILVVPAVAPAPWLAVLVVRLLVEAGPLGAAGLHPAVSVGASAVVAAALAGVASVLGLLLPVLASGVGLAAVRAAAARGPTRTLGQRLGLDLVLIAVAGLAIWQLRLYGAPLTRDARGALGVDPVLVATPALGLVAGSLLATRVVPRLGEVAERLLARRRGLVGALGGRGLARRPLRATRSALLLILATALGTFATAHAATWSRSQEDQATYRAAAEVRVVEPGSPDLPDWAIGPALRSLAGVERAMPVDPEPLDVGRAIRGGQLLALDPAMAPGIVRFTSADATDEAAGLLAVLEARRPAIPAIPIDGVPRRFAVTVDAAMTEAFPPPGGGPTPVGTVEPSVILADGDGRLQRFTGALGDTVSGGQRIVITLPRLADAAAGTLGPAGPFRLVSLEIRIDTPDFVPLAGTVEVLGLESSEADAGDGWTPVAFDPGATGWSWSRLALHEPPRPYTSPDEERPGLLSASVDAPRSPLIFESVTFRSLVRPASAVVLPALASDRFLELAAIDVGDEIPVSIRGLRMRLAIEGSLEAFPSLEPAVPFAIVDRRVLELARFAIGETLVAPDEWWISTSAGLEDAVAEAVAAPRLGADAVISRAAIARALSGDPVQLGIIGALGLGAAAAVAFAAVGFVVSAALAAAERLGEFALLRALGMSGGQLSAWLALESAALLVVGLVAGGALGLLLAWLVLPFSTLTATGEAPVPTPAVMLPWGAFVPAVAIAVGLFAGALVAVRRQLLAVELAGVLRARDD